MSLPSRAELLARLDRVKPGATMCPGKLARECGGHRLAEIRPLLQEMEEAGEIEIFKSGEPRGLSELTGHFRVSPRREI
jgi:hypothetical protein